MSSESRVVVFIDGANLYSGMKDDLKMTRGVKIDKLAEKLANGRQLQRIFFYTTPSPRPSTTAGKAHQRFLDKLGWIDYLQVRKGRIVPRDIDFECRKCSEKQTRTTHVQKGVDTRIVVDMVSMAVRDLYDVAILVSGDSDLAEAVDFIREHTSKRVESACVPGYRWAKTLREAADKRVELSREFLEDCLLDVPIEEAPLDSGA